MSRKEDIRDDLPNRDGKAKEFVRKASSSVLEIRFYQEEPCNSVAPCFFLLTVASGEKKKKGKKKEIRDCVGVDVRLSCFRVEAAIKFSCCRSPIGSPVPKSTSE